MKKLLGSLFVVGLAFALQATAAGTPSRGKIQNQEFTFGGNYRKFDYVEGDNLDSETGNMPGFQLGYQIELEKFYAAADLTIVSSHTTYNGSDQSGKIPVTSSTVTQLIEFEANAGMPLTPPGPFLVKGYTGLGYHYWRRGDAGVTNGVSSYREDYSWLVLPLGLRFEQNFSDSFKISLDVAARLAAGGQLDVKLSQIGNYQDASLNLGAKVGYKIQLPIDVKLAPSVHLIVTPFYEYSEIGESDSTELLRADGSATGTAILEPRSRTKQTGGTLVLGYIL